MKKSSLLQSLMLVCVLLAGSMGFVSCSDDDDNSALTQQQARTMLNNLWQFSDGNTEYALSMAESDPVLVSEDKTEGLTSDPIIGTNYVLQPDGDDYSSGMIFFEGGSITQLYYKNLGTNSFGVSLDNVRWFTAKRVQTTNVKLSQIQAMALLLSGVWAVTDYIMPLPDDCEVLYSMSDLSISFSKTKAFCLNYSEQHDIIVDEKEHTRALDWSYEEGRLQADPNHADEAYTQCRLAFTKGQYLTISDLNENGATIEGFSYGSNFLEAKAVRKANLAAME